MDLRERDSVRVRQAGLAVARLGLVVNLGWNGLAKFTAGEANSIAPLVGKSPLFAWALGSLGLRGVSDIIGIVELAAVALLLVGVRSWWANAAATTLCAGTFLITLSFFATSVDWSTAGWNAPDAFLLKRPRAARREHSALAAQTKQSTDRGALRTKRTARTRNPGRDFLGAAIHELALPCQADTASIQQTM